MKKRITIKRSLLTLIAAVLSLTAQAQLREDAFIIRTTDGAAQGLLFGDVEKITFSNLDDEGVPHTDVYYQELHYPDTIIRVLVSEITEVSFEKPRLKFQSNVVNLAETQELLKWIYRCEETESGHKLTIAPNVSSSLLPKVNQMLIYFEGKNDVFDGVFAGRVKSINKTSQGYEVETERPEGIQDIYEELIGVEAVTDNTPGVRECLRKANALPKEAPVTRVDGGTSYSIPFDLNLSYDFLDDGDLPEWGPNGALLKGKAFSLSGGIRGTLGIRLAYEFSKERNFLSIGTDYEYTPYFNISFAANATWIKPFYEPIAYPIINIPIPSAPIFTLSVGGAPFISLSGSASVKLDKTLPTTKVHNLAYYLDGEYRSGKSDMSEKGAGNKGELSISVSLEGSAKAGIMLGMYIGTQRVLKSAVGIMAELSIGPKLTGSIGVIPYLHDKNEPDTVSYQAMKDWGLTATFCNLDLSLNFYREVLGKPKSYQFASMSFDYDPYTYSFLPTFEAPEMTLPSKGDIPDWSTNWLAATAAKIRMNSPQGNSLFPVLPGIALYDEEGKVIETLFFDTPRYWMGTKDDPEFDNLQTDNYEFWKIDKKYKLYPIFQFTNSTDGGYNGGAIRVDSYTEATFEGELITGDYTLEPFDEDLFKVKFNGVLGENFRKNYFFKQNPMYGFLVSTDKNELEFDKQNRWSCVGRPIEPYDYAFDCEYTLVQPSTTYYYRAFVHNAEGRCFYGDIKSFTTPAAKKTEN